MSGIAKIILTLSLIVNVVLLGLIGGGAFRMFAHLSPERSFHKELETLPPDVKARIDEAFEKSRSEMREIKSGMYDARQEVRSALNADPFIREDYDNAVEELNQIRYRMIEARAQHTGDISENLSAADRRKFAGYLLRGGRKGKFKSSNDSASNTSAPQRQSQTQKVTAPNEQKAVQKEVQAEPFNSVMLPMPDF